MNANESNANARMLTRWQFTLWGLCGVTVLIAILAALARIGPHAFAFGMTLVCGALQISFYAASPYRRHLRVQGTLAGGLLFLISLWLPFNKYWDHSVGELLVFIWEGGYTSYRYVTAWRSVHQLHKLILIVNALAVLLPIWLLWKPVKASWLVSSVAILGAVAVWSMAPGQATDMLFGYWLWCVSLTLFAAARLVPLAWRFEGSTLMMGVTTIRLSPFAAGSEQQ